MPTFAAVMTGQGAGAIATIQICGDAAATGLHEIFRRLDNQPLELATGRIILGHIVDNGEPVDQVTLGCEAPHIFAINCHGNPLLVARIMGLLQRHGFTPVSAQQLRARMLQEQRPRDTIGVEAQLALATVKTVEGAVIINNQVKAGLSLKAGQWRDRLHTAPVEEVAAEAGRVLKNSETARLLISGCTIALIGPPNTGKSTLLNMLAGREKAIVTEIRGTTRDWVSAEIHLPPLAATLIDTAGIDPALREGIDTAAQDKSMQVLEQADVVLLVLDIAQPAGQLDRGFTEELEGRRVLTVLNKSDLTSVLEAASLPPSLRNRVHVSAKLGTGIDELVRAIHQVCGLPGYDRLAPVAFTDRQRKGLERLRRAASVPEAAEIIEELIHGPPAV